MVSVHLLWRLATCLAMTCQACAFIAAAVRTRLLSTPIQWTRSTPTLCLAKAKQGLSTLMSRIASVFKACTGQTARANNMMAALQLMTAERDGLAAKLQVLHCLICYISRACSLQHSLLAGYITAKIYAVTRSQNVCSSQMDSNATVSPSDLHAQGNSRGIRVAILHGQSVLCNNTALAYCAQLQSAVF